MMTISIHKSGVPCLSLNKHIRPSSKRKVAVETSLVTNFLSVLLSTSNEHAEALKWVDKR